VKLCDAIDGGVRKAVLSLHLGRQPTAAIERSSNVTNLARCCAQATHIDTERGTRLRYLQQLDFEVVEVALGEPFTQNASATYEVSGLRRKRVAVDPSLRNIHRGLRTRRRCVRLVADLRRRQGLHFSVNAWGRVDKPDGTCASASDDAGTRWRFCDGVVVDGAIDVIDCDQPSQRAAHSNWRLHSVLLIVRAAEWIVHIVPVVDLKIGVSVTGGDDVSALSAAGHRSRWRCHILAVVLVRMVIGVISLVDVTGTCTRA
jgi:hypothetical protein